VLVPSPCPLLAAAVCAAPVCVDWTDGKEGEEEEEEEDENHDMIRRSLTARAAASVWIHMAVACVRLVVVFGRSIDSSGRWGGMDGKTRSLALQSFLCLLLLSSRLRYTPRRRRPIIRRRRAS
jgi:hypothetical protein